MAELILIPRLGVTVEEVTIIEWKAADGDLVTKGDVIVTVETDKVEAEIEAPQSGRIVIEAEPGDVCLVGALIGEIRDV